MTRRGVSLFEMMVALTVGGMLVALSVRSDLALSRYTRGRAERAAAAANLGALAGLVRRELEALGTDSLSGPDLRALAAARITYRAYRGLVEVCSVRPDSITIAVAGLLMWRLRLPDPSRDSILLLARSDSAGSGEGWWPVGLTTGGAAPCPDGRAGLAFGASLDSATIAERGLAAPAVARIFETGALAAYNSAGTWQVGFESLSSGAPIQPAIGPIDGAAGFRPVAWNRAGLPAGVAGAAGLDVVLRAIARRETAVGPGFAAPSTDSLVFSLRFAGVP